MKTHRFLILVVFLIFSILPVAIARTLPRDVAEARDKIYWADQQTNKIQRANLDGTNAEDIITGLSELRSIALDVDRKIYWSVGWADGKIQRANLDGRNVEDIITGLESPSRIALDAVNSKIYWTDDGTAKIQRADLDGANVQDIVTNGLNYLNGIAVDGTNGKIYWADLYKIQRANLDGTNREDIFSDPDFTNLSGVNLDVAAGKIYWTNLAGKIQRANLDGTNREDIVRSGLISPSDIALDTVNDRMYWTDAGTDKIQSAALDGTNIETLISGLPTPIGIALSIPTLIVPVNMPPDAGIPQIDTTWVWLLPQPEQTDPSSITLKEHTGVNSVSFSPDGRTLATGSRDKTTRLWEVSTGRHIRTLEGHTESVHSVFFSPDGQTLATGSRDETIRLWEVNTGRHIRTIEGHTWEVLSVSFSPDGQTLASGSWDNTIRLWEVSTGRHIRTIEGHTWGVNSVSFSPDGQTLASGNQDDPIRLWEVSTGQHIRTLKGHTAVDSVSFSPDGQTLASGSRDKTIRLWEVSTGQHIRTIEGHTHWVLSVSFSPDGRTLASGSRDKTIRLWEARTGRHIRTLEGHTDSVDSVSFSPDGQTLASGSRDKTIRLWDLSGVLSRTEPSQPIIPPVVRKDVSGDGVFDIEDVKEVAANTGKTGEQAADVNADGVVNIADIVLLLGELNAGGGAPAAKAEVLKRFTVAEIQQWLVEARSFENRSVTYQRGILFLESLLAVLTPQETALLTNYPNPLNPETWIPYQLAAPADVVVTLYDIKGRVVRRLDVGHQPAGMYQSRARAAYWDGKNRSGEPVASGVYFYTLTAGEFIATRKLLIRK